MFINSTARAESDAILCSIVVEFYEKLQQQVDSVDKNDVMILMGDWNAEVRRDASNW